MRSRAQALDLGQQLAAAGVELEQAVEVLVGADAGERGADGRRILADAPRSSSGLGLVAGARRPSPEPLEVADRRRSADGRGESSTWVPEYWSMNWATFSASAPTTMFCGITAPEAPPLWMA